MLLTAQHLLIGIGSVQVILVGLRATLGPRPRQFKVQLIVLLLMIGLTSYAAFVVAPKVAAIRVAVNGPIASLSDDNPAKAEFGRLHAWSGGLMALALVGAMSLVWFDRRE